MYGKEINFVPVMKFIFLLNDLPEWNNDGGGTAYSILRRSAHLKLKKSFLDPNRESDKVIIDELKEQGKEHLIGIKDESYYENKVMGNEKAFLRFFIDGAFAYYANKKSIAIPQSMKDQSKYERVDQRDYIEGFISARLKTLSGKTCDVFLLKITLKP
jgi:phage/plasmid-associated DNA primase